MYAWLKFHGSSPNSSWENDQKHKKVYAAADDDAGKAIDMSCRRDKKSSSAGKMQLSMIAGACGRNDVALSSRSSRRIAVSTTSF